MNHQQIATARNAAKRFLAAEAALVAADSRSIAAGHRPYKYYGSKESGALRRASLDLTRVLAEMRKP